MNIAWYLYFILPLIGFVGMFAGGYWGVGCGWLIVPVMLIFGFSPAEAVGVSLLQMVPSTLPVAIKDFPKINWGRRSFGKRMILPLGIGCFITAFTGRFINAYLYGLFGSTALMVIFCLVNLFIGYQTLFSKPIQNEKALPVFTRKQSWIAFLGGLGTGIFSSLLGIGGAMIIRPILVNIFKVPEQWTARAVRILLLLTTSTGGLFYVISSGKQTGFEIFVLTLIISAGGMMGFPLGVKCNNIVCENGRARTLQRSFVVIPCIVLSNTILKLLGLAEISRILSLTFAVLLFIYIVSFTFYSQKHAVSQKEK
ncbi:MAG: sulfite exporter TauE/SafE family protein [Elusimicrobiaceae bacterium]|nr:sulfite exporter TauE/SafE family protein [Elusimicrobiaceae bacterium]